MTVGLPPSLHRGGQPLTRLYPGWQASARYRAPADGLDVLSLHHTETGQEACWWLSSDDEILACHALALDSHWNGQIMEAIGPALQQFCAALLSGETPLPDDGTGLHDSLVPLTSLPPVAQFQLLGLWFQAVVGTRLRLLSPASLPDDDEIRPDTPTAPFAPGRLRHLLDTQAVGPHTMTTSPFSGRMLRAELTMPTEKGVACRFSDEEDGQTFYLFWYNPTGRKAPPKDRKPLFYHPATRLLLGDSPFLPLVPVFLLSWFISNPHCVEELRHAHPFRLEDYGVGRASALWEEFVPATPAPAAEKQEEAGQNRTSFPFSSELWVRSSIFRAGQAAGLPGRERWKKSPPQNHEKTTDAGHENHDES